MLVYLNIKIFFLVILLTSTTFIFSQKEMKYDGIIYYNDLTIKYHLAFKINNNNISGFSITNKGNINETKNEIKGTYNKKSKTLNIQELSILQTTSTESKSNFCYLNLILEEMGGNTLMGSFTGYFSNDSICASGYVNLIKSKKLKKVEKIIKKKKEKAITKKDKIVLKKNDSKSINCYKSEIILQVWDSKKEDGDKINLILNNKIILKNYEVTQKKKIIPVNLTGGENIIQVVATSIGKKPPNTIGIEIITPKYIHPFITKLQLNEAANIKINLKE